jgi:hypothetical protein
MPALVSTAVYHIFEGVQEKSKKLISTLAEKNPHPAHNETES